jgi:hypothetical protein
MCGGAEDANAAVGVFDDGEDVPRYSAAWCLSSIAGRDQK